MSGARFDMKVFLTLVLICGSVLAISAVSGQEPQQFKSGPAQVQLIELYTSEGCSSCPPADRWLSSLKHQEGLWKTFVPLAFHVDYWDYIGWQDPFAKREFSQRQRRYAAEFSEPTVYTPGVRKSGLEWRQWRRPQEPLDSAQELVGNLSLKLATGRTFKAEFVPQAGSRADNAEAAQLSVALLGNGLRSKVTRGENRGKTLQHDFVVLNMTTVAGKPQDGAYTWSGSLPESINADNQKLAIAAWVTQGNRLVPIQAVGGMLTN